jgi:hypothetical protein
MVPGTKQNLPMKAITSIESQVSHNEQTRRTMNAESTADHLEAVRILGELAAIRDRLKPADLRFLESWQARLARQGDQIQIGSARIEYLRQTLATYQPGEMVRPERRPARGPLDLRS